MKPINQLELNKAYVNFIVHFVALVLFVLVCISCFFITNRHEMKLLTAQSRAYEKLTYDREEVVQRFDHLLLKFQRLGQYVAADAQELSNQSLLITGVHTDNNKVKGLLSMRKITDEHPSFELYGTMTRNVMVLASLKDSLSQTRFQMESLRDQLDGCAKSTRDAVKRLNRY
jgi:hypothetical protein